jgi:hypothetical protein
MKPTDSDQLAPRESRAAKAARLADFDHDAARREGWGLADYGRRKDGTPHVELQKLDAPPSGVRKFDDDKDVWAHVAERARAGSVLHMQALDLVDPRERAAIRISTGIL